jgi:hypothetical protein
MARNVNSAATGYSAFFHAISKNKTEKDCRPTSEAAKGRTSALSTSRSYYSRADTLSVPFPLPFGKLLTGCLRWRV